MAFVLGPETNAAYLGGNQFEPPTSSEQVVTLTKGHDPSPQQLEEYLVDLEVQQANPANGERSRVGHSQTETGL